MSEYDNALRAALYTRLASGTALTALLANGTAGSAVYYQQAPDDATLPYVVFSYAGGPGHENRTQHETIDELVFIRGYNDSGPALAGTISSQIDTLLRHRPLTVSGWTNVWVAPTQTINAVESGDDKVKVWMRGAFWRIRLDKE